MLDLSYKVEDILYKIKNNCCNCWNNIQDNCYENNSYQNNNNTLIDVYDSPV